MGYTPVFDSIYTGTLYGKWPAAAVWASLLPLLDKNGCIDMSLQAISGMTGWPMDLLKQGIEQLMEPDPDSRTPDEDGRRLVPIDPNRPWGWRAVNHAKYREKARKQNYDAERTASGKDAERKRKARAAMSRDVPRCPAMSRDVPLSDTNTNTNTDTEIPSLREGMNGSRSARRADALEADGEASKPAKRKTAQRIPDDFELTEERRLVAEAEKLPAERTFAKFVDYWRAASGAKARKYDWDAAWRNWCRIEADFRSRGSNGPKEPRKTLFAELTEALDGDE